MHEKRRQQIGQTDHKTAIMGMIETGTREVRAHVIPNAKRETLQKAILDRVGFGRRSTLIVGPGMTAWICATSMSR